MKRRWRALARRSEAEAELDEELRFHLEKEIQQNVERGMSQDEARRVALVRFGGVEKTKEECRDVRGVRVLDELAQDLRFGLRLLSKKPGFTAVAVLTLALGVGANTAIFSVVNALILRPLPLPEAESLVLLFEQSKKSGALSSVSYPNFKDYREGMSTLEAAATFRLSGATLTGTGEPERLQAARVSSDFFRVLRVGPHAGRLFAPEEDAPGGARVVVITHGLWQRRFGADPSVVGRTITLDDNAHTVVGVLPHGFEFPYHIKGAELFSTIAHEGSNLAERGARATQVVARLRDGASMEQARAEATALAARLEEQYRDRNAGVGATVIGLQDHLVGGVRPALWTLLGAVGFVLLIACSNVANLLLVRATARQREIAVRTALGASRRRIVRQLLTESLLLSLLAGACGLLLAVWGVGALVSLSPGDIPRLESVRLDPRVLAFTFAVSLLTGVLFGLVPALRASKPELTESLKEGSRGTNARPGRQRVRGALIAGELALALMLLVGAGLLLKSFWRLQAVDPGFDPQNVLTMRINLPRARYADGASRAAFVGDVTERVRGLAGVRSVAFGGPVPFSSGDIGSSFRIEGRAEPEPGSEPGASFRGVTPDYFRALGMPLLRGRDFAAGDVRGAATGAAIVNETLARKYFAGEDPLGKVLVGVGVTSGDEAEPRRWEVVGVVGDVRHSGLSVEPGGEIYLPYTQQPWTGGYLVVKTSVEPMSLAAAVRAELRAVDKDQAVAEVRPLEQMIAGTVARPRFYAALLTIFACVGLVLAVVGVYGVISYSVTERTHEIGIRMALGARAPDILRMVIGGGMRYVLVGVFAGLVASLSLARVIESLLFGVSAWDPLTFAAVSALATAVALLACYVPAKRATRVDPMVALRYE
ncbi:MAG TPA: ABC transporter permease [Pyrinomonadaceae bacterium]|nr:ABC transporter permease [Pyrinomonadaceae bacterium]